jgi:hypothetical protein
MAGGVLALAWSHRFPGRPRSVRPAPQRAKQSGRHERRRKCRTVAQGFTRR